MGKEGKQIQRILEVTSWYASIWIGSVKLVEIDSPLNAIDTSSTKKNVSLREYLLSKPNKSLGKKVILLNFLLEE
jgi:hypothetical protein